MISAFFAAGNDDQTESEDAIWAKLTSQVNAMSRFEGRITHRRSLSTDSMPDRSYLGRFLPKAF